MENGNDHLKEYLRSYGLSATNQRISVLKVLDRRTDHPTAERIFEDVRKNNDQISLATVYNVLSSFAKSGITKEIFVEPGRSRFDPRTDPHHHFFCRICGKVFDIDVECSISKLDSFDGNKIETVHGIIHGICKDCMNKRSTQ
jgi:Fe2+ or Zn2+ uptake regulation protein